jgi:hypothetical protein
MYLFLPEDFHGVGSEAPQLDAEQNWEFKSASENGTHTTLSFTRVLDTCDTEDVAIGVRKLPNHEYVFLYPIYLLWYAMVFFYIRYIHIFLRARKYSHVL